MRSFLLPLLSGVALVALAGCGETASQTVEAGICVARLGSSSVRYEVGLFAAGEPLTAAAGHFIHVYVDRATRRPVPVPSSLREVLETLLAKDQ